MTSITPKLTAAITTIAMLAPAAGAQAASYTTLQPARHWATARSERQFSTHHSRRSHAKFQCDRRAI